MQRKIRRQITVAITFFLLFASCIQTSYVVAQEFLNSTSNLNNQRIQVNYENSSLTMHEMSAAELQKYQDSIGTYQEGKNYNDIVAGHGTGLRPPTYSEWVEIGKNAYVIEEITYQPTRPAAIDLSASPWFPPIGNQGDQASCVAFAVGYYCKTYQEAKEHGWNLTDAKWIETTNGNGNFSAEYQSKIMSPAFLYNLINGGEDQGTTFDAAFQLVSNVGICSWEKMPYYGQDCDRWPTVEAWAEAPLYRSNSTYNYQYLYANTTQGIDSLKNWLAAGNPAIIGINMYENLFNRTTYQRTLTSQDLITTDTFSAGRIDHSATIVGYDDLFTYMENGTVSHGAFKIANSWGKGGWEFIPDGYYWISYEAMKKLSTISPVMIFEDLIDYQPELLASFNIVHEARYDCSIIFGLGTPNEPIVIKNFTDFTSGASGGIRPVLPFCENNIVFDLTEFKDHMTGMYNQPFFMTVYDTGTNATGTINSFAVGNTSSPQTPLQTLTNVYVNLTLNASFAPPIFNVSPTTGPPSGEVTFQGIGFTGTSVNISYFNPITFSWLPIVDNLETPSMNFSYSTYAPDLLQSNPTGDNAPCFDNIIFRAQDNGNGNSYNSTAPYIEGQRGLIQVSSQIATGLFGNNTDMATTVLLQKGQSIVVAGKWFSPGEVLVFWDNTQIGTASVDQTGSFSTSVIVPATAAGQHTLTVDDGASNVTVTLTRLPTITNDYSDKWHTKAFTINLTPDFSDIEVYYRINNGQVCTVSTNGQPLITSEGSNNVVEYWGIWNVYGTGNRELGHITISGAKLDVTPPQISMRINNGSMLTTSTTVTFTLTAIDSTSGIQQMRFSNDGAWSQANWKPYADSESWELTSGSGEKTVYCQVQDKAGLTTTTSASITLSTPQPSTTPSPTVLPTLVEPDYSILIWIALLILLIISVAVGFKYRRDRLAFL